MRRWLLALTAALMAVSVLAAPALADGHEPTLFDAIDSGGLDGNWADYDILTAAVSATGLDAVLDDPNAGPLTVFIPNDGAFRRLVHDLAGVWLPTEEDVLNAVLSSFDVDTIREIVLYHAVAGAVFSTDVPGLIGADVSTLTSIGDGTFTLGLTGAGNVILVDNDPDIVNPRLNNRALDIVATNGVAHGITRVLVPVDL